MKFGGWQAVLAGAILTLLTGSAWGELTPEQTKTVQELIRQCGDKDFQAREDAQRKLVEMGGDVMEMVETAAKEAEDAEVKTRCQGVMSALKEQVELNSLEPSKVTLDVKEAPLEEVLKELARQSGNKEIKTQDALSGHKVTVKVKDMPYWQALNTVCSAAGACYEGTDRGAGSWEIGIASRPQQVSDTGTNAGPTMVMVAGVKRNASTYLDLRGTGGKPDVNVMTFDVQVFLEDRLPMTSIALRLTDMTTADGVNHPIGQRPGAGIMVGVPTGNIGAYWSTQSRWESATEWPTGASTVQGTLEVSYGIHAKELKIEKIFDTNGVEVNADGRKVSVTQVTRRDDSVTIMMILDDPAVEATELTDGHGAKWGMFLVDPEGKRHPASGIFMQTLGKPFVRPVMFPNVPNLRGDWTLIYVYPEKLVKASYPLSIQGVPLP